MNAKLSARYSGLWRMAIWLMGENQTASVKIEKEHDDDKNYSSINNRIGMADKLARGEFGGHALYK